MKYPKMLDIPMQWLDIIGRNTLETISAYSFDVCLIAGLVGAILYIFGYKKGKEIATLSPVIYILIKIIGGAVFGV
jgi:hypothetical protein